MTIVVLVLTMVLNTGRVETYSTVVSSEKECVRSANGVVAYLKQNRKEVIAVPWACLSVEPIFYGEKDA